MNYFSYFLYNSSAYFVLMACGFAFFVISSSKQGFLLKKINYIYFAFFLILFSGLRWNCGTDWDAYKDVFDSIVAGNTKIDEHFDLGYVLLNKIIAFFSDDYTIFLLIDSLVAVSLIVKAIDRNEECNNNLSLYIFFLNYFCVHYMGSNRRIIAIGFLLNGFIFFFEKKYKRWIVCQILAFFFHRASIVGVLIIIITRNFLTDKKIIRFLVISIILGLFQFSLVLISNVADILLKLSNNQIFRLISYYSESVHEGKSAISFLFAVTKRAIFIVLFIYYRKRYCIFDKRFNYFLNIYVYAVIFYCLLNGTGQFLSLTTYFTIIEIFIWGLLYKYLNKKDKYRIIAFLIFLSIFQMFNNFTTYTTAFIPYKAISIY